MDVVAKKPKMPVNACANDNWLGRERVNVKNASTATKALAALGRCCWKQVRLGRREDPAVQETGLTANSIFLVQPTGDVPIGSDRIGWIGSDRIGSNRIGSDRMDRIRSERINKKLRY